MNELNNEELAKVPKVFIGNKIDMRNESNMKHISKATVIIFNSIQSKTYSIYTIKKKKKT